MKTTRCKRCRGKIVMTKKQLKDFVITIMATFGVLKVLGERLKW